MHLAMLHLVTLGLVNLLFFYYQNILSHGTEAEAGLNPSKLEGQPQPQI